MLMQETVQDPVVIHAKQKQDSSALLLDVSLSTIHGVAREPHVKENHWDASEVLSSQTGDVFLEVRVSVIDAAMGSLTLPRTVTALLLDATKLNV